MALTGSGGECSDTTYYIHIATYTHVALSEGECSDITYNISHVALSEGECSDITYNIHMSAMTPYTCGVNCRVEGVQ